MEDELQTNPEKVFDRLEQASELPPYDERRRLAQNSPLNDALERPELFNL